MYMYRELSFNRPQQINIIIEVEVWMEPALHQDLRAALRDSLPYFIEKFPFAQYIRVLITLVPVKGAEFTLVDADVRVIDIAVDYKTDIAVRMKGPAHIVGHHAESEKIRILKKVKSLLLCNAGGGGFFGFSYFLFLQCFSGH